MRPEELLPDDQNQTERDGVTIRKGTVGAFLANARIWTDENATGSERASAERDMIELLPALRALGIFDVFSIHDEALALLIDTRT